MKVRSRWAALGAGLLLCGHVAAASDSDATVKLETSGDARVGGIAPSFGLWGLDGNGPFILEKLRKEPKLSPLIVTFGASWCTPCRKGLPRLKAFAEKHPEVRLVLVDVESDAAKGQAWVKEVDLKGAALHDKFEMAARRYGAAGENKTTLPRTFLVDTHGRVRAIYSVEGKDLEQVIEADLASLAASGAQPSSAKQ